ncbi:hypothetical protein PHET_01160 [Paragonimus heterotremus]|uniref:NUP210 Ig-like domain-containing protein n=1 Tax=Paragonimus heterotremus TaxID=100268 RepID=A0A8J4STJ4_9TREM|nr:hypothetical protein PHET_01160 [Paragonimus heterotremus]
MLIHVVGLAVGFTELEASLRLPNGNPSSKTSNEFDDDSGLFRSTVSERFAIAAYRDILFYDPVSASTHVALGSTRTLLFQDGPQPWPLEPSTYFANVIPLTGINNGHITGSISPSVQHQPYRLRSQSGSPKQTDERFVETPHSRSAYKGSSSTAPLSAFSMRCESTGTYRFALEVGHRPSARNFAPMKMSTVFTITCHVVSELRLALHPTIPKTVPDTPGCSLPNHLIVDTSSEIPMPNTAPFLVSLLFFGADGQKLEAVDSLPTSVSLLANSGTTRSVHSNLVVSPVPNVLHPSKCLLFGRCEDSPSVLFDKLLSLSILPSDPHFVIEPREPGYSTGTIRIQVTARVNQSHSFSLSRKQATLQAESLVRLIQSVSVQPSDHLRLFHFSNAELSFSLIGGSGHFYVAHSTDDGLLQVTRLVPPLSPTPSPHDASSRRDAQRTMFSVRALRSVGEASLIITDLCFPALREPMANTTELYAPFQISLHVDVIGLGALRLRVLDRIQLNSQTVAFVEAVDTNGDPIPANFTRFLELHIQQHSLATGAYLNEADQQLVLGVSDATKPSNSYWQWDPTSSSDVGTAQFVVRGLSLGWATLSVSTELRTNSKGVATIRSNVVEIQVFSPLQLAPCNFNMLLGAEHELRATGGPQPADIEFFTEPARKHIQVRLTKSQNNPSVVRVHVSDNPGSITIRARAVSLSSVANMSSLDSAHHKWPVISETSCTVNVVAISGIRIGCPLASFSELKYLDATDGEYTSDHPMTGDERFMIACSSESSPSCGVTPLWAEGIFPTGSMDQSDSSFNGSLTEVLSPSSMGGCDPPLRFIWRLSPPQLSTSARLMHYMDGFNVEATEVNAMSGLGLVGRTPGRVTVHLTVESTRSFTGQLTDASGSPVQRLEAQLTVFILSSLRLQQPAVHYPRQLLLSPDSQYQLKPWFDVLPNSHVEYDIAVVQTDLNGSLVSPSPSIDRHIMITSGGLIHTLSAPDGHSVRRQATVRIRSFPKIHSSDITRQSGAQSFADQVLLLQVEIKPPRYIQAIPTFGDHLKSTTGLHVGGPYQMSVTYHDEFGKTFDAVAEKYLRLKTRLHRTDLVDVQLLPSALTMTSSGRSSTHGVEADDVSRTTLSLRVLSVLPDQSTKHISALEPITTVLQLSGTDKAIGFWPVYLSVPYGGELNIGIPSALIASQWMCLPDLIGGSVWSSNNPSVLWVDANSRLLLARRAGKAYLVYRSGFESDQNLPDNMSNTTEAPMRHPSYLIRLTVSSLSAYETALRLVRIHSEDEPFSPESAVLPLLNHLLSPTMDSATSVRFLIQHTNRPESLPDNNSEWDLCAGVQQETVRHHLSQLAPFQCNLRLISSEVTTDATHYYPSRLIPNWLSVLALWHLNDTVPLESELATLSLERLVTAQLEPVVGRHGSLHSVPVQWQCVLRPTTLSTTPSLTSVFGLILPPRARVELQLKDTDTHEVLATAQLIPLPGLQLLVPPPVPNPMDSTQTTHYFWVNNPTELTRRMLLFMPPTTAAVLSSNRAGRPVVRSKSPHLLDATKAPRPVASLSEVAQIVTQYIHSLSSAPTTLWGAQPGLPLTMWTAIASEQVHQMENEAAISQADNEQTVKQGLLWVVELKANIGDSAVDTVVDVVISFRQTGQHITLPVHVRLPSRIGLSSLAEQADTRLHYVTGFSWIHLVSLILITLLVAVMVHIMLRSATLVSSSSGSAVTKNLPSAYSPSTMFRTSPRQLWTQNGRSIPPQPSFQTTGGVLSSTNLSPRGPDYNLVGGEGDLVSEEHQWRRALSGGSPSRLRQTFDSL